MFGLVRVAYSTAYELRVNPIYDGPSTTWRAHVPIRLDERDRAK